MAARFNFASESFFRDPMATAAALRAGGPVVPARFPLVGNVWVTTTHEATARVLKDAEAFPLRKNGIVAGLFDAGRRPSRIEEKGRPASRPLRSAVARRAGQGCGAKRSTCAAGRLDATEHGGPLRPHRTKRRPRPLTLSSKTRFHKLVKIHLPGAKIPGRCGIFLSFL